MLIVFGLLRRANLGTCRVITGARTVAYTQRNDQPFVEYVSNKPTVVQTPIHYIKMRQNMTNGSHTKLVFGFSYNVQNNIVVNPIKWPATRLAANRGYSTDIIFQWGANNFLKASVNGVSEYLECLLYRSYLLRKQIAQLCLLLPAEKNLTHLCKYMPVQYW